MDKKLKILNLYAGIGGNRKLWQNVEVTAVEQNAEIAKIYQDFYPTDQVIVGDAHQYLLEHFAEYDFIWSSPPCPTHSRVRKHCAWKTKKDGTKWLQNKPVYPDMNLYQEIIFLQHFADSFWVVENVRPYYEPLINPVVELHRHIFWTNFDVNGYKVVDDRNHFEIKNNSTVYGVNLKDYNIQDKIKILRNMVNPEVGAHFLNCARHDFPPMQEGLFTELTKQKYT